MAQVGLVSPTSESMSDDGHRSLSRKEARKLLKEHDEHVAKSFKSYVALSQKVCKLAKTGKLPVTYHDPVSGREITAQIGRGELRQLATQIAKEIKSTTSYAFELTKTRRKGSKRSGFSLPQAFNQDLVNFFAQANVGNRVEGTMRQKTKCKNPPCGLEPDPQSLRDTGERLNNWLFFTQPTLANGRQNPLYGIVSRGTLTSLFSLYAYYAGMSRAGTPGRLQATREMFEILRPLIVRAIEEDVSKYREEFPELSNLINQIGRDLLSQVNNYNNPGPVINTSLGKKTKKGKKDVEIFNPFSFPHSHFAKIVRAGTVPDRKLPNAEKEPAARQQLEQSTWDAYNGILTDLARDNAVVPVANIQQNFASMGIALKNETTKKNQPKKPSKSKKGTKSPTGGQSPRLGSISLPPLGGAALPGLRPVTLSPVIGQGTQ